MITPIVYSVQERVFFDAWEILGYSPGIYEKSIGIPYVMDFLVSSTRVSIPNDARFVIPLHRN